MKFFHTPDTVAQVLNKTIAMIYASIPRKESEGTIEINREIELLRRRIYRREKYAEHLKSYWREYQKKTISENKMSISLKEAKQ